MTSVAVKRLTASDLTFFKYHFDTAEKGGNQKAINLNATPFVSEMFPALPELAAPNDGVVAIRLSIFGPGNAGAYTLARQIIKHGSYKNWRLDGEFVRDPDGERGRFNDLAPGDLAVFAFEGLGVPSRARMFLLSQRVAIDESLHRELAPLVDGSQSMVALGEAELSKAVSRSACSAEHSLRRFFDDEDLEDAAQGGSEGSEALSQKPQDLWVSPSDLEAARRAAKETGDLGEALVDAYLETLLREGRLIEKTWVSRDNAVAPKDFTVVETDGTRVDLDVKATKGKFERRVHISLNELKQMASSDRYDLYRVYEATEEGAELRVAHDLGAFARSVLSGFMDLPAGVTVDGISARPSELGFGEPVAIEASSDEPEQESLFGEP